MFVPLLAAGFVLRIARSKGPKRKQTLPFAPATTGKHRVKGSLRAGSKVAVYDLISFFSSFLFLEVLEGGGVLVDL